MSHRNKITGRYEKIPKNIIIKTQNSYNQITGIYETPRQINEDLSKRLRNETNYFHNQQIIQNKLSQNIPIVTKKEINKDNEQENIIKNIEEINKKIISELPKYLLDTFTKLTIENYKNENSFLVFSKEYGWSHYSVDINNKNMVNCYTGIPTNYISYYKDGKVPFLTECPKCKSLTKLNYLHNQYNSPMGGIGGSIQSSCFNEVYCDNHYFYDSKKDKHYIQDQKGVKINVYNSRKELSNLWVYNCWNSHGLWREYNPKDPDGKITEQERKKKEAYDIEQQILQLQSKLSNLTN
jgi:hypothetical protein